ncbi:MAG: YHS domain-containing (seleno)protein [Candidatus Eisenbacteria bacterium]
MEMRVKIGSRIAAATAVAAIAVAGISTQAWAVKTTGREYNTLHAGLGAKGYDVVSYFTDDKAAVGSQDFTHAYGGVTWRFVSKEHRDLFVKSPAKYAAQYGGFCSWGVAGGKLFDVDPENGWTIRDGKLYLNFNAELNGVFANDAAAFIAKAARNWPKLDR